MGQNKGTLYLFGREKSTMSPYFVWNGFISICQKVPSEKLPFAWPPADQENTANALREAK